MHARNYALGRGLPFQDSQDFAQFVSMVLLKNPDRKPILHYLFIDFLRVHFGQARRPESFKVAKNLRFASEIDDERDRCRKPSEPLIIEDILKFCSKIERAVLLLRYKWGFDLGEIGQLFGESESGISVKLKQIKNLIRQKITQDL